MNEKVIVRFSNENFFYKERLNVLLGGCCNYILPLSIVHRDEVVTGYYCTLGYKRISELDNITADGALQIAENIAKAIDGCYQHLIFPKEYVINPNTTYINHKDYTVKFACLPDLREESLQKKYKSILAALKNVTNESGSYYLDMLIDEVSKDTMSSLNIRLLISRFRQDINKYHLL